MTYKQFIEALRPLLSEALGLIDLPTMHEDPRFREWRHRVTDLVKRIKEQGYPAHCSIAVRGFDERGSYTHTPSAKDRLAAYNRDLRDTMNELRAIIEGYATFGEPGKSKQPGKGQGDLEWPEKMTLSWLWLHMPVWAWGWCIGLIGATFYLGITAGRSQLYEEMKTLWKPVGTVNTGRLHSKSGAPTSEVSREPSRLLDEPEIVGLSRNGRQMLPPDVDFVAHGLRIDKEQGQSLHVSGPQPGDDFTIKILNLQADAAADSDYQKYKLFFTVSGRVGRIEIAPLSVPAGPLAAEVGERLTVPVGDYQFLLDVEKVEVDYVFLTVARRPKAPPRD